MNLPLTKRQKEMLSVIYNHIINSGYPPTFEEMREALGVSSNQSVIDLLNKLEEKRVIKRNESAARSIVILPIGYKILEMPPLVPFLGMAHAGVPVEAIQIDGEWEQLPGDVARLKSEVFFLQVSGDSMINAGINEGDKVLVQIQKEFSSGDIVLADIAGESTIKRFISDDNPPYVYLKPENPKYEVIPFTDEMKLVGRVISIIKGQEFQRVN